MSARTVADASAALDWLAAHPDLPIPWGVSVSHIEGTGLGLCANLDTPEQVRAWADAIGMEPTATNYKGIRVNAAWVFAPFYISATAAIRGGAA